MISSSPFSFDLKVHFRSPLGHIVPPTDLRGEGQSTSYRRRSWCRWNWESEQATTSLHPCYVNMSEGQKGLLSSVRLLESTAVSLLRSESQQPQPINFRLRLSSDGSRSYSRRRKKKIRCFIDWQKNSNIILPPHDFYQRCFSNMVLIKACGSQRHEH